MDMSKIVRTPNKLAGGITPEEKLKLKAHSDLWISRIMRTDPIEPDKIIPAIEGLYEVSGLKKPRVIIVPSPLVMTFAYGASAAILYNRKAATGDATGAAIEDATRAAIEDAIEDATRDATRAATWAATRAATRAAIRDAIRDATRAATRAAIRDATRAATRDATEAATRDATEAATGAATGAATEAATWAATWDATWDTTEAAIRDATRAATWDATRAATWAATGAAIRDATRAATKFGDIKEDSERGAIQACFDLAGKFGIDCAAEWTKEYSGGNMWAQYDCFLTSLRDVLGLRLDVFEKYKYWEEAAIHGGFRLLHEDFCIVSDFPEFIKTDDRNLPHCENGPSHRWRDGWSLYHWHGVKIPKEWIEDRDSLTPTMAMTWENMEQRHVACEIIGWDRIISELNAKSINKDEDPEIGELIEVDLPDIGKEKFLRVLCGTGRKIALPVPPDMKTALQANSWTFGYDEFDFTKPEFRT